MANFSVALFDLDGTLVDTNHLILTSFQQILGEHLGRPVPAEEIYSYFGEPLTRTMARYDAERAEELVERYRTYNLAQHDRLIRQFSGVSEAIQALKQAGIRLAVVTSKKEGLARRGLRVCGLESYFETVVGMDSTEKHKPDPEPALEALRRLGEEPGPHVLMVGDSPFDVLCGRNAGIRTAAVSWSVNERTLEESRPDYWLKHPGDLVDLVVGGLSSAG